MQDSQHTTPLTPHNTHNIWLVGQLSLQFHADGGSQSGDRRQGCVSASEVFSSTSACASIPVQIHIAVPGAQCRFRVTVPGVQRWIRVVLPSAQRQIRAACAFVIRCSPHAPLPLHPTLAPGKGAI
jgi:hypothetical protein